MDARLPGNSYRSPFPCPRKRAPCSHCVLLLMSHTCLRNSKIVLLFNDELEHNRWNDSLAAILSEDRVFSRCSWLLCVPHPSMQMRNNLAVVTGSGSYDAAADAAPMESDSKAWQDWQQVVSFAFSGVATLQFVTSFLRWTQEHVRSAKTGGGAGVSGSLSARGRAGNGRVRSKSGGR